MSTEVVETKRRLMLQPRQPAFDLVPEERMQRRLAEAKRKLGSADGAAKGRNRLGFFPSR